MKNKIQKVLESIDGIKKANVKPFFYGRFVSKLKNSQNPEIIYNKYEKVFLITLISFVIIVNIFFVFNYNDNSNENILSSDLEEVYFKSNKNDIINFISNEE